MRSRRVFLASNRSRASDACWCSRARSFISKRPRRNHSASGMLLGQTALQAAHSIQSLRPSWIARFSASPFSAATICCGWSLTGQAVAQRSEEHTPELQSHSEISYAVFCLKKKKKHKQIEFTFGVEGKNHISTK